MAWFYLYDSDITATVSASAEISSSDNDSAVVKVTASGYIPAGYWIYSTGVVVTITINGQSRTQTLFGNGSYYYGSEGAKTATFSVDVPKGTGAKSVPWSVAFKRAMDGNVYDTAHTATGNISVGALPSYTVSYNANGGTGAPSAQTKWYGSTLKLSTATPTRTGYSFLGWSTANDSSVEYAAGANYTANSNVTLYAVWKANTYTVKYDANGGTGAPGNQTKTYGVDLTLSSAKPTRTNYNFLGWATSASATSPQYAAGGEYTANTGVTLYAVWQLAYTKPRISSLSVERCTEDGTAAAEGTYARVSFAWATDRAVSSITVTWTSVLGGSGSTNIPASGTSGNVSFVFGGGNLSADATYTVAVSVADSGGSTPASTTLSSIKYTIDFLAGGKGAAFFKAAENERLDIGGEMWVDGELRAEGGLYLTNRRGGIVFNGTNLLLANIGSGTGDGIQFAPYAAGGSVLQMIHNTFFPIYDNQHSLGAANNRWKAIYSINGTIQTSDRNKKTAIKSIDGEYIELFDKLQPVTFKLVGDEHDRTHVGFISQDVKAAMDEVGLTPDDFAAYCRDVKMERIEVVDEETGEKTEKDVPVLDENGNPVYIYSLRYSEFIALNTRMIQENRKKITALEEENAKLKERLAKIEAMLGIEE